MNLFRFQGLEIWQLSINLTNVLFDVSDKLEHAKYYRASEQLRSSSLSISNNIAEGSGSYSDKDFANFLNVARRSIFETANILILVERRGFISNKELNDFLINLQTLSKKITAFRRKLIQ